MKDPVKKGKNGHPQAKGSYQACWSLVLKLLASDTDNIFLLFKPPSLWYVVLAALAGEYSISVPIAFVWLTDWAFLQTPFG